MTQFIQLLDNLPPALQIIVFFAAPAWLWMREKNATRAEILFGFVLGIVGIFLLFDQLYSVYHRWMVGNQPQTRVERKRSINPPTVIPRARNTPSIAPKSKRRQSEQVIKPLQQQQQDQLVILAQKALAEKMCYFGPIDGKMGPMTAAAVREFNGRNIDNINPYSLTDQDVKNLSSKRLMPCGGTYKAPNASARSSNCRRFNGKLDCD